MELACRGHDHATGGDGEWNDQAGGEVEAQLRLGGAQRVDHRGTPSAGHHYIALEAPSRLSVQCAEPDAAHLLATIDRARRPAWQELGASVLQSLDELGVVPQSS